MDDKVWKVAVTVKGPLEVIGAANKQIRAIPGVTIDKDHEARPRPKEKP